MVGGTTGIHGRAHRRSVAAAERRVTNGSRRPAGPPQRQSCRHPQFRPVERRRVGQVLGLPPIVASPTWSVAGRRRLRCAHDVRTSVAVWSSRRRWLSTMYLHGEPRHRELAPCHVASQGVWGAASQAMSRLPDNVNPITARAAVTRWRQARVWRTKAARNPHSLIVLRGDALSLLKRVEDLPANQEAVSIRLVAGRAVYHPARLL